MWARAQPEILGPTAPLLQQQIQNSLLGTGAPTGWRERGKEMRREGKENGGSQMDAVHFLQPFLSLFHFLVGT